MRVRLKNELMVRFENALDRIDRESHVVANKKPIPYEDLPSLFRIESTLESGEKLCLFYSMEKAVMCVNKNYKWHEVILND